MPPEILASKPIAAEELLGMQPYRTSSSLPTHVQMVETPVLASASI